MSIKLPNARTFILLTAVTAITAVIYLSVTVDWHYIDVNWVVKYAELNRVDSQTYFEQHYPDPHKNYPSIKEIENYYDNIYSKK